MKFFKKALGPAGILPPTTSSPSTPVTPASPTTSSPSTPVPPATSTSGIDPSKVVSQNVFDLSVEEKQKQLNDLINIYAKGFIDKLKPLVNQKEKLKALKDQSYSLFELSKSNCTVWKFVPKTLKNNSSPCDFLNDSTFSNDLTFGNVTLQEVQKNYYNYINALTQLIKVYDEINSIMDDIKTVISNKTTSDAKLNESAMTILDSKKEEFNTEKITLENDKKISVLQNEALFDTTTGRSILDCYEEIIAINENLCEKVYQPLQKSFSTLGMGPVTIYAKQLINGYKDIMRIYVQELTPIYYNVASKNPNIDQKKVQYTLNMLSKIIPQSYRIQILAIETGLFDVTTKNDPAKLQAALGGGFNNNR